MQPSQNWTILREYFLNVLEFIGGVLLHCKCDIAKCTVQAYNNFYVVLEGKTDLPFMHCLSFSFVIL